MGKRILFAFVLLCAGSVFGQRDSIIILDEVVLTDIKLRQFANGIKVNTLNDSVLTRNRGTLNDNLRNTTHIYFRENGYGMVSSASFRGTGAQQTAVVWNGININSQLTGQTDFNTILSQSNNEISVRSGGGSTQYGTGAIGGSIHLNNNLRFEEHFENNFGVGYGSFNTRNVFYNTSLGNGKTTFKIGLGHLGSDNDFKYLGTDAINENGAFAHYNFDISTGFILSDKNILKLYHNTFLGDRDFSGTLTAPSDDNYRDLNTRSLIEWASFGGSKVRRLRLAHLYERYRYFPNKEQDDFSEGKSNNIILNYDYKLRLKKLVLDGIIEGSLVDVNGTSLQQETRNTVSGTFLLSHQLTKKMGYGINLRKDWVSDFESPFVFAADARYQISDRYSVHLNASKNYRVPTFNDLYWVGAGAVGNDNLLPETSIQAELGQTLKGKAYRVGLTAYYIDSRDLIQWRPDISGIWSPVNISNASHYGAEFESQVSMKIRNHNLKWDFLYAFTKSLDDTTRNQLLYVPLHRLSSNLAYAYKKWGSFLQFLYNGSVYTTTDSSNELAGYELVNGGITYTFKKVLGAELTSMLKVNNIMNTSYQNVAFRPMPNRNFNLQFNFKF